MRPRDDARLDELSASDAQMCNLREILDAFGCETPAEYIGVSERLLLTGHLPDHVNADIRKYIARMRARLAARAEQQ